MQKKPEFTNNQIEAAHKHILATEHDGRWTRTGAIEALMQLWWLHKKRKKAERVLASIDCYGFDEWTPRLP